MSRLISNAFTFHNGHHAAGKGVKLAVRDVSFWYNDGQKQALKNVSLDIPEREVTAFIGPSGCGKSTLLKCLNRINETVLGARMSGDILMDGRSICGADIEPNLLRKRFGWVAQQPNPFPKSIYDNVAYGTWLHGLAETKSAMNDFVEQCLRKANLWDEVKDILQKPGTELSGGQQQRLCIARALSTAPEVLLMDEPCSALDPLATAKVEDLIDQLRQDHTIVIITHNMQQAARVSQRVAYFHLGELLEWGDTEDVMMEPKTRACRDYVTGVFG